MAKATILFADNDPRFRETMSGLLEQEGYLIVPATNPTEARRKLEVGGIDLAILDIRLVDDDDEKDTSGLDLAKEVALSVPRVFILSGFLEEYKPELESLRDQMTGSPVVMRFVAKQDQEVEKALMAEVRAALAKAGEPKEAREQVTQPQGYRPWVQLGSAIATIVALLLALGAGIEAIILGDPRWLLAVVFLAILMVVFIGIAVFMPE